jgi:AcrR family transcriptional regulator
MATKEIIFEKALILFSENGYTATSIRNICAEVGIKESSFYNHYKSKDQLLDAIFDSFNKALLSNAVTNEQLDLLTTQFSLKEMLLNGLKQYIGIWENPTSAQMWFVVSMEQYRNSKAGRIIIDESNRRISKTAYTFEQFQKKGKMKAGDPLTLANLYSFSIRSLHLDYGLKKLYNQDYEQSYKSMQAVSELFCAQWGL